MNPISKQSPARESVLQQGARTLYLVSEVDLEICFALHNPWLCTISPEGTAQSGAAARECRVGFHANRVPKGRHNGEFSRRLYKPLTYVLDSSARQAVRCSSAVTLRACAGLAGTLASNSSQVPIQ
jgi:hypothetical protein